jgi:hypothetical protein
MLIEAWVKIRSPVFKVNNPIALCRGWNRFLPTPSANPSRPNLVASANGRSGSTSGLSNWLDFNGETDIGSWYRTSLVHLTLCQPVTRSLLLYSYSVLLPPFCINPTSQARTEPAEPTCTTNESHEHLSFSNLDENLFLSPFHLA